MVDQQRNDEGLRELALFAGAGGGILGGHLLGWRTIAAVEYNAYARSVLLARQNDGTLPPFPIWDDVRTFDGRQWRGLVDVVSGGFPCQDISESGNGIGLDGNRSGLWSEFKRIIGEVRPRYAFIENSPMLPIRGLNRILCDLASLGFDAKWSDLSAADVKAPHLRKRTWIVANANSEREKPEKIRNMDREIFHKAERGQIANVYRGYDRWPPEPNIPRVDDGTPFRNDRHKAIGNSQVPRVAATAFNLLKGNL